MEGEVKNVYERQMLEKGLERVSVQCAEHGTERIRQSRETPWGIEENCRDVFIEVCAII